MNDKNLEQEFSDYIELVESIENLEEMVTGVEIQAGVTAISRSVDLLKRVKLITEKTDNVEIKEIIADLKDQLADTKNLLVDTKEELINLKSENQELKQEIKNLLSPINKLTFNPDEQVYFMEIDKKLKTPYCPHCYDNNNKKIQLGDSRKAKEETAIKYQCYEKDCNFMIFY